MGLCKLIPAQQGCLLSYDFTSKYNWELSRNWKDSTKAACQQLSKVLFEILDIYVFCGYSQEGCSSWSHLVKTDHLRHLWKHIYSWGPRNVVQETKHHEGDHWRYPGMTSQRSRILTKLLLTTPCSRPSFCISSPLGLWAQEQQRSFRAAEKSLRAEPGCSDAEDLTEQDKTE